MFSYIAVAGAAFTVHKLLTSTAAFINAVKTVSSITTQIEEQPRAVEDFEGLLKVAHIMINDYDKITKLDEAKVSLCRKSLLELETNMDTLRKAKADYDAQWIRLVNFDEEFYKKRMLKSAILLRMRLQWLE